MKTPPWTEEQLKTLQDLCLTHTYGDIANIIGRTYQSVVHKSKVLKLHKKFVKNKYKFGGPRECYMCGSNKTNSRDGEDIWWSNKPTPYFLCDACYQETHRIYKRGHRKDHKRDFRVCYACGLQSIIIFDPVCTSVWRANRDEYGYAINYLCFRCFHNICYYTKKWPRGYNFSRTPTQLLAVRDARLLRLALCKIPEYWKWKKMIYERDQNKCVKCKQSNKLHVHHIKQLALILIENNIKTIGGALECDEIWDINNGVLLCKDCHYGTYKERKVGRYSELSNYG